MLKIYKKCEKSLDNLYGINEIENLYNYDRPFLLCISSQDLVDNSVFGTIKEGARAARVRTSDELAGGFKINEIPFDFLGIKYEFKNIKEKKNEKLLDDFIYPFLKKGNDIKKQARKINFFTYCNATNIYVELEKSLIEKLSKDGYSEKEINDILSQISVVSIGSEIDISGLHATSVLFKDVNDSEIYNKLSKKCSKKMDILNRLTTIEALSSSAMAFCFYGTGEHSLKEYFKNESYVKSSLCACVSLLVENSIKNNESDKLIPIDQTLLKRRMLKYNSEFEDSVDLLNKLDSEIDYGEVSKYSKSENEILNNLDKSYKKLLATKKYLENETKEKEKIEKEKQLLISEIKDKSSDVAFAQIVSKNGMWNNALEQDVYYDMKTDKEVRQEYDKIVEYFSEHIHKL